MRNENDIFYVKELYMDEEKTLAQSIIYQYHDSRERDFERSKLNPHVTKLVRTDYMNGAWKVLRREYYNETNKN